MNRRTPLARSGAARPSRLILILLALVTALYVLAMILKGPPQLIVHLVLIPKRALGPEPWQLITYAFVHLKLGALIGTLISLWFFGAPLEQQLGRSRLLQILLASTVAGGLASAALGRFIAPEAVVMGAFPASMALIAAFGLVWGATPIALFGVSQMRASTCAAIFLGISSAMYLMSGDYLGLAGGAVGAGVGALWVSPLVDGILSAPEHLSQRWQKWRIRRRYKVIPGGRDSRTHLN
jgi:membrane associated rhomboid family serine protease